MEKRTPHCKLLRVKALVESGPANGERGTRRPAIGFHGTGGARCRAVADRSRLPQEHDDVRRPHDLAGRLPTFHGARRRVPETDGDRRCADRVFQSVEHEVPCLRCRQAGPRHARHPLYLQGPVDCRSRYHRRFLPGLRGIGAGSRRGDPSRRSNHRIQQAGERHPRRPEVHREGAQEAEAGPARGGRSSAAASMRSPVTRQARRIRRLPS